MRRSLFLSLFCMLACSYAMSADWSRYKPRTFQTIIKALPIQDKNESSGVSFGFEDEFPSIVKVVFLGKTRKIPASRRSAMEMAVKVMSLNPELLNMFQSELLFTEGKTTYWLPVQEQSVPYYFEELKVGDLVDLYLIILATRKNVDGKIDHIFLVNEFQRVESKK